jgi:hypothetical protein
MNTVKEMQARKQSQTHMPCLSPVGMLPPFLFVVSGAPTVSYGSFERSSVSVRTTMHEITSQINAGQLNVNTAGRQYCRVLYSTVVHCEMDHPLGSILILYSTVSLQLSAHLLCSMQQLVLLCLPDIINKDCTNGCLLYWTIQRARSFRSFHC